MNTIYPVILSVPDESKNLAIKKKVSFLSEHARLALEISAQKSGIYLGKLLKGKNGAPLPYNDNFWSITHKSKYVAGVTATARIGIDVEEIRRCSKSLFKKVANDTEWNLANAEIFQLFFRYWTAKESVLKAAGTGLKHLSQCLITHIIDDNNLIITYQNKKWFIEHLFFDDHIASITKNSFHVKWLKK